MHLVFFFTLDQFLLWLTFCVFFLYCYLICSSLVVSTSAVDCLEQTTHLQSDNLCVKRDVKLLTHSTQLSVGICQNGCLYIIV